MSARFDSNLFASFGSEKFNYNYVNQSVNRFKEAKFDDVSKAAWLLKSVTLIDLTTLAGDDTPSNVDRLCRRAATPIHPKILKNLGLKDSFKLQCGAVCVYPNRVADCVRSLKRTPCPHLPVASVATGFPAGQTLLSARLGEIRAAIEAGAKEIDIVINRTLALQGDWQGVFDELVAMKQACGIAHMKAILATGELESFENIYKASMVAMMAGSDFIKTSTGKETVNATLPVGLVMARAIRNYYQQTGRRVGLKPAGGIRTSADALQWLLFVKEELGKEWLCPELFRLGASALLDDVERVLFQTAYGRKPFDDELIDREM